MARNVSLCRQSYRHVTIKKLNKTSACETSFEPGYVFLARNKRLQELGYDWAASLSLV